MNEGDNPFMPFDDEIVAACGASGSMTYVVRNRLQTGRSRRVSTQWVLRQCKRLERIGKVKRVGTSYRTQYCWARVY
jgi:hypothetical protein